MTGTERQAAAVEPDADLLALGREWSDTAERWKRACEAEDDAEDRAYAAAGPRPELEGDDQFHFGLHATGKHLDDADAERIEASLSGHAYAEEHFGLNRGVAAKGAAVVAAYRAWKERYAAALAASGYEDARSAVLEIGRELSRCEAAIFQARARTMEGLKVKARVARFYLPTKLEEFGDQAEEAWWSMTRDLIGEAD